MRPRDAGEAWSVIATARIRAKARARGYAGAFSPVPVEDAVCPVDLEGMSAAGIRALRTTGDEPVVFLETDLPVTVGEGRVTPVENAAPTDRCLDAREGVAWVFWTHDSRRLRLVLQPTGELSLEEASHGGALAQWRPPPLLQVPVPPVEEALARWNAAPWLEAQVREAAEGSALQRATAGALIARFADVPLEVLLDGHNPWNDVVAEWCARPAETRAALVEHACFAADELAHELEQVRRAVAARETHATAMARRWLLARDDLHSLALVLDKARTEEGEASLRTALELLDEEGQSWFAVFLDARVDDERLAELSWREPDAWWGISC